MLPPAALYVGAGTDIPLVHLPSSQRIVCVDGQPFSEFGILQCACHVDTNCFSRRRFLADLDRSAHRLGLAPHVEAANALVRHYGDRVRYYTNTSIPEHIGRLGPEGPFDSLVVRGHHPHEAVLDLLGPSGNVFLGFTDTVYSRDGDDTRTTVVDRLHACHSVRARFDRFTLVEEAVGTRLHCSDWFDFVRHASARPGGGGRRSR